MTRLHTQRIALALLALMLALALQLFSPATSQAGKYVPGQPVAPTVLYGERVKERPARSVQPPIGTCTCPSGVFCTDNPCNF